MFLSKREKIIILFIISLFGIYILSQDFELIVYNNYTIDNTTIYVKFKYYIYNRKKQLLKLCTNGDCEYINLDRENSITNKYILDNKKYIINNTNTTNLRYSINILNFDLNSFITYSFTIALLIFVDIII